MHDDDPDDFYTPPVPAPNAPDVEIAQHDKPGGPFAGVRIKGKDGGYQIESMRDLPTGEYDPNRYRLERDPTSTRERERWRLVRKEQEQR